MKLPQASSAASMLFVAVAALSGTQLSNVAIAQDTAKAATNEKKSVRVPAMRNRVYAQLARAQKLADEGDKIEGFNVLEEVEDRIDSLNSYERAMLWNFYGFMYYANDDVNLAVDSFEKVVAEEAIPESLRVSTLYSLAQLTMQQKDYEKTLRHLARWKSLNTKALTASQEILFAQVHFQNKDYKTAIGFINKAINMTKEKGDVPKENWFVLQRAAYYQLKQPKQVTKVIEEMVRYFNKPVYWLQLSGMYGEIGEEEKQLATMESAWQAGYIEKSTDIVTLAQLYRYHNVPYKAAKLLQDAIKKGVIKSEEKYLEMIAQAFVAAKDDEKALPVLIEASKVADSGKYDAQLAQVYLNSDRWNKAIAAATSAIERGGLEKGIFKAGTMHLVIGMAQFNLKAFDKSLKALKLAKAQPETKKVASQWLNYVEKEKQQAELLAETLAE